jgi:hypothetical protein
VLSSECLVHWEGLGELGVLSIGLAQDTPTTSHESSVPGRQTSYILNLIAGVCIVIRLGGWV